jgi:hypothetical protein
VRLSALSRAHARKDNIHNIHNIHKRRADCPFPQPNAGQSLEEKRRFDPSSQPRRESVDVPENLHPQTSTTSTIFCGEQAIAIRTTACLRVEDAERIGTLSFFSIFPTQYRAGNILCG